MATDFILFLKKRVKVFLLGFIIGVVIVVLGLYLREQMRTNSIVMEETINVDGYRLVTLEMDTLQTDKAGNARIYDHTALWNRSMLLEDCAAKFSESEEIENLCETWNEMSEPEQASWIAENIIATIVPGSLSYEITYSTTVPVKDVELITNSVDSVLDDYVEYAASTSASTETGCKLEISRSKTKVRDISTEIGEQRSNYYLKCAVLSVACGLMLGLLLIIVLFLKDSKSKKDTN